MTSRICGTCSIAHLTCCSEAVEKAIGYTPTDQTLLLRKLSLYGMMIRDHALHLYLFCLPDVFGKDSVLDFDKSQDEHDQEGVRDKERGQQPVKGHSGQGCACDFRGSGKVLAHT